MALFAGEEEIFFSDRGMRGSAASLDFIFLLLVLIVEEETPLVSKVCWKDGRHVFRNRRSSDHSLGQKEFKTCVSTTLYKCADAKNRGSFTELGEK